jgi:hypothetical protein
MNDAKLNTFLPNWNTPVEPYMCTDAGPTEGGKSSVPVGYIENWNNPAEPEMHGNTVASEASPNGDNTGSYPTSITLPDMGDLRNRTGGTNSPPAPGKTGAGI